MTPALALTLTALLALNAYASARALRNADAPRSQRIAQLALIWMLPLLGAVLCLLFYRTADAAPTRELDRTAFVDNADAGGGDMPGGGGGGGD